MPGLQAKAKTREALVAYCLILPGIAIVSVFVVLPLAQAVYTSFFNWSYYTEPEFVWLNNYARVLKDEKFLNSLLTVIGFTVFILPCVLLTTFSFALLMKSLSKRFNKYGKVLIYIPTVLSGVVTALIFSYLFAYEGGLLNALFKAVGLPKVGWLIESVPAFFSVALTAVWMAFGFNVLLLMSGLYDIPDSYYESAQLDGANFRQVTVRITIPLLKNLFSYLIVTASVGYLQLFDLPYMMTGGGPLNATMTPAIMIYNHFLRDPDMNYSVAASLLLFIVLGAISMLIFRFINSEKLADD